MLIIGLLAFFGLFMLLLTVLVVPTAIREENKKEKIAEERAKAIDDYVKREKRKG